jgi:hypothetical protein
LVQDACVIGTIFVAGDGGLLGALIASAAVGSDWTALILVLLAVNLILGIAVSIVTL